MLDERKSGHVRKRPDLDGHFLRDQLALTRAEIRVAGQVVLPLVAQIGHIFNDVFKVRRDSDGLISKDFLEDLQLIEVDHIFACIKVELLQNAFRYV